MRSKAMEMFLEPFKSAAAEGAVVELKMRLLAGLIPELQQYAIEKDLKDIEIKLVNHFDGSLSAEEKDKFRLCRELRNKVLHADFQEARRRLNKLGIATPPGQVIKIEIPVVSVSEISKKIAGVTAGAEGIIVADTASTDLGTIYGWFLEAGNAGDFQNAAKSFKGAAAIVDRLTKIAVNERTKPSLILSSET
jgi:hypothetical protein